MCGIAGIISLGAMPLEPEAVRDMTDVLEHRGPDDAGYVFLQANGGSTPSFWAEFADPKFRHQNEHLPAFGDTYSREILSSESFAVGFGHRRLSILDLSSRGHQPMPSRDRRYWIVHNGEIYNFRELREELARDGCPFHTNTDTEVILRLWERQGPDCLQKLNGMFAFAIYDRVENEAYLVRDRFGVKPLYFTVGPNFATFASEVKALFRSGVVEPRIDPDGLVEYTTFQNMLGRRTIWEGVELLEPGTFMRFRPATGEKPTVPHLPTRDSQIRRRGNGRTVGDGGGIEDLYQCGAEAAGRRRPRGLIPFWRYGQRLDRRRGGPVDTATTHLHRRVRSDQCERHRTRVR